MIHPLNLFYSAYGCLSLPYSLFMLQKYKFIPCKQNKLTFFVQYSLISFKKFLCDCFVYIIFFIFFAIVVIFSVKLLIFLEITIYHYLIVGVKLLFAKIFIEALL